jgi:hypothetical protein
MRRIRNMARSIASIRYMETHALMGVMVALVVVPMIFKV